MGGSYENQVPDGPDIGGFDYETFQGSLYFTPTEQSELGLSLYVSNDLIDMSAVSALPMNCENVSARASGWGISVVSCPQSPRMT